MASDDKNKKYVMPIELQGRIKKAIIDFRPDGGLRIETDPNNPQDAIQAKQIVQALFGKKAIYTGPPALQAVIAANTTPVPDSVSLKKAIERYLRICKPRWRSKTLAEYEAVLNRFSEFVGSCALNKVTQLTIEDYLRVGQLSPKHQKYLDWHRRHIFVGPQ